MFERFTQEARDVVVLAQGEARSLGHGWIGTEHLLLAVLGDDTSDVTRALGALGLDAGTVRTRLLQEVGTGLDDGTALRDLGIDLDAVRQRVEERFGPGALDGRRGMSRRQRWRRWHTRSGGPSGSCPPGPGHIPFTRRAKKSLELSLREALAQQSKEIRVAHLMLGLMRADGLASGVVSRLGVEPDDVRQAVLDLGRAA
jgi:ATP-dependent Clp protease ATP-binding subunit ClpA